MKGFKYYKPQSLKEASELLKEYNGEAHILNGGTDLIIRMKENFLHPKAVVDIKHIPGLHAITFDKEDGLRIGACLSLGTIAHHRDVVENFPIIADSAEVVGSGQIRNRATLVGNICNASPLADTATPLLALDAEVIIYSPNGTKLISIHHFFKGVRKNCLNVGEIVTGIKIPYSKNLKGAFKKGSRRQDVDLSTVCTSVVKINDEIRIALGAVAPTPIRGKMAEAFAKGKNLTHETITEIAKIAVAEASPIDDVRSSKEYRLHMVEVLVTRSLEELKV
ncbi:FAD binding domain-containing protein [Alkaliphilus transvaalensis]|uniref:FAD binding domain-containing protein n=1 Tax=Alkaliphilus transvaalensis TaxID=114628 RepID=UPI00047CA5D5|nr:xanthine dehydrogenase family protein subunit M [Alkaliphilus transvaalensis]